MFVGTRRAAYAGLNSNSLFYRLMYFVRHTRHAASLQSIPFHCNHQGSGCRYPVASRLTKKDQSGPEFRAGLIFFVGIIMSAFYDLHSFMKCRKFTCREDPSPYQHLSVLLRLSLSWLHLLRSCQLPWPQLLFRLQLPCLVQLSLLRLPCPARL